MFEDRTEEKIKQEMLDSVSNEVDKSERSLIYDAISPAALKFAETYIGLGIIADKFDVEKLDGEDLERFVYQKTGIIRNPATKATTKVIIKGHEGIQVSAGDITATDTVNFVIQESRVVGAGGMVEVEVECEQFGNVGNVPAGAINRFPVAIPGLTSVTNPLRAVGGYEAEEDGSILKRYYEHIQTPPISGNRYHYINWAKEVSGVGDVRVVPLWDGPGTVRVVIIDTSKQPADAALVQSVAEHINEERPVGASVSVVSAINRLINISFKVIKDNMFTLEQVKTKMEENITQYLAEIAFKQDFISYAHIGKIILESAGVLDYSNLLVNNTIENTILEYEETPVLGEVVINE